MRDDTEYIRQSVVERFTETAHSPADEKTFPVGPEIAKKLGYDAQEVDALPATATESFCGVGNPLSLGRVQPGETVLDLGSGAGMDSILAASHTGPTGRVIGVDMTPAMIHKAQRNAETLRVTNVEFRQGTLEQLPVDDDRVDVAIANGVFNLCPDKPTVLREVHRVLRPGGRLQMADILLHDNITPEEVANKGTWSD
jgi:SAM-dependent methyltransferase